MIHSPPYPTFIIRGKWTTIHEELAFLVFSHLFVQRYHQWDQGVLLIYLYHSLIHFTLRITSQYHLLLFALSVCLGFVYMWGCAHLERSSMCTHACTCRCVHPCQYQCIPANEPVHPALSFLNYIGYADRKHNSSYSLLLYSQRFGSSSMTAVLQLIS